MKLFLIEQEDGSVKWPVTPYELRSLYTHVSIPDTLECGELIAKGVRTVHILGSDETAGVGFYSYAELAELTPFKPNSDEDLWAINLARINRPDPVEPPVVEPPVITEPTVANYQSLKMRELALYTDNLVSMVAQEQHIPTVEIQTWPIQMAEATAWEKDSETETPMLDAIAEARGIDVYELRNKALGKAKAYQKLVAYIIGRRQAIEDVILEATSIDSVQAIQIKIDLPPELFTPLM